MQLHQRSCASCELMWERQDKGNQRHRIRLIFLMTLREIDIEIVLLFYFSSYITSI